MKGNIYDKGLQVITHYQTVHLHTLARDVKSEARQPLSTKYQLLALSGKILVLNQALIYR